MNLNAKKWVRALRSGKYEQGRGRLRDWSDRFCCLGVACELAIKAGVITGYRHDRGNLPRKVQTWLGLASSIGRYDDGLRSLVRDNDGVGLPTGMSFTGIATIIERQPKGLFKKARKRAPARVAK